MRAENGMTLSNHSRLEEAFLAGWKACVESLQDTSFAPPLSFDSDEEDLAQQCFHGDPNFTEKDSA